MKGIHFSKVVSYIQERSKQQVEGEISFEVRELETLYTELLEFDNIPQTDNVTRFTERLTTAIPGLEVRMIKDTLPYLISVHVGISVHPGICYQN